MIYTALMHDFPNQVYLRERPPKAPYLTEHRNNVTSHLPPPFTLPHVLGVGRIANGLLALVNC